MTDKKLEKLADRYQKSINRAMSRAATKTLDLFWLWVENAYMDGNDFHWKELNETYRLCLMGIIPKLDLMIRLIPHMKNVEFDPKWMLSVADELSPRAIDRKTPEK